MRTVINGECGGWVLCSVDETVRVREYKCVGDHLYQDNIRLHAVIIYLIKIALRILYGLFVLCNAYISHDTRGVIWKSNHMGLCGEYHKYMYKIILWIYKIT